MVDRATTVSRNKIGGMIGHLDAATMRAVEAALANFLEIG
jgi:mRNA-degrading endonuclease toxin of MazEF toxin-antitoxin module